MHTRGARLTVVALLVAVGGAVALLLWDIHRSERALDNRARAVSRSIDSMAASVAAIGFAQQRYLAAAGAAPDRSESVAAQLGSLRLMTEQLTSLARAPKTPSVLDAFEAELQRLVEVDGRAQQYAREGQTFVVSDLLADAGRARLTSVSTYLATLRTLEAEALDVERAALRDEVLSALVASGAVWLGGLLLLAFTGSRRTGFDSAEGAPVSKGAGEGVNQPEAAATPSRPSVDLAAAANLCAEFSRITAATALPALLARAAGILDARGLIVWMAAGEQLFAVAAHGYDPRMLARLAPIDRSTVNATATAWRTGRIGSVRGDGDSPGAIVAPMLGPSHCIGVLAAEVRHGREQDPGTRAVTSIFAAQLASIVAAWPSASPGAAGDTGRGLATG